MKKLFILLLIIALIPSVTLNAQTKKRNFKKLTGTELTTTSDSLNYAMGYASGVQNRFDVLKGDTLKLKNLISFCLGLESAYKDKDATANANLNGKTIAESMLKIANEDSEKLIPIEGFKLNIDSVSKGIIYALRKDNDNFNLNEYSSFINEHVFTPLQTGENINLSQSLADSISIFFGFMNGQNILKHMVKGDTASHLIDALVNGYNSYIKNSDNISNFSKGEMLGHLLWEQIGNIQNFFDSEKIPVNKPMVLNGLIDGIMQNPKAALNFEQSKNFIDSLGQKIQSERMATQAQLNQNEAIKNQQEGFAFLQNNALRPEVTTTESGLQYEIIKQGTGAKPTESSTVKVHYEGKLIDGTIFDSSYQRGEPIEFVPTQVIKGWTEGLQLMPEGSTYIFYIPYNLAYGPNGASNVIPPYATLTFKIELIQIVK